MPVVEEECSESEEGQVTEEQNNERNSVQEDSVSMFALVGRPYDLDCSLLEDSCLL